MTYRLLDGCCGAGGAGRGFADAGFDVVGVDLAPQPRYPFEFVQADVMGVLADAAFLARFDVVAVGPPCQFYSQMSGCRPGLAETYPDLIGPVRDRLLAWGGPYVIENVPGAPLLDPVTLCGQMFGLDLYRHRLFESNVPLIAPPEPRHVRPASRAGHWTPGTIMSVAGHCAPISEARRAMGIDWMNRDALVEAIPPAYTRHVGALLIDWLDRR